MTALSNLAHMLGRQAIPVLFSQGLSASAGLRQLKALGQGYRRKTFLADWREITGAKKLERAYRFIPRKYALSYQMMSPTETKQTRDYKYVFDAYGNDTVSGDPKTRTVSLVSDKRKSIEDVEAEMNQAIEDMEFGYQEQFSYVLDHVELKAVFRKVK